jgi:hypothetical protein
VPPRVVHEDKDGGHMQNNIKQLRWIEISPLNILYGVETQQEEKRKKYHMMGPTKMFSLFLQQVLD